MISSFPILSTKWRWETREKTSSEADTVILRAGSALLKAFIWSASSLNKTSVVGLRTPAVGNLGFGSFVGSSPLASGIGLAAFGGCASSVSGSLAGTCPVELSGVKVFG